MSKLVERAFNKAQKIIRAKFLGSPNLLTTSDLNRQFENIKNQLDSLEDRTGVLSDISFNTQYTNGTWTMTPSYSYLEVNGCAFSPSKSQLTVYTANSSIFVCLTASIKTVSYAEDASHEISGATFEDNTTKEAASHLVYYDESIVAVADPSSLNNLVAVLGYFIYDANQTSSFRAVINASKRNESVLLAADKVGNEMRETLATFKALIEAQQVNLTPKGAIILWSGNASGLISYASLIKSVPYGYVPCGRLKLGGQYTSEVDAWNSYLTALGYGTLSIITSGSDRFLDFSKLSGIAIPDLTDRFVMAAGGNYAYDTKNGSTQILLSASNIPAHKHSVDDYYYIESGNGGLAVSGWKDLGASGYKGSGDTDTDNRYAAYATHDTKDAGEGQPFDYIPPYIGIYYMVKII